MFEYVSVKEMASKWEMSERRIQKLCEKNRIKGVQRFGCFWMIPQMAEKQKRFKKEKR